MKINTGLIVTAITMLIFYLRLAFLRGRKRRFSRQEALERRKNPKKKGAPLESQNKPSYQVKSWWLVGIGCLLMLLGVTMYTSHWFPQQYVDYWWVAASLGVLVFTFSIG